MFAALSMNFGNIRDSISCFTALAPIVFLNQTKNDLLAKAAPHWHNVLDIGVSINTYEIKNPAFNKSMDLFCTYLDYVCTAVSKFLHMESSPYNVRDREIVVDKRPDNGASLKQIIHYAQFVVNGIWEEFDYGSDQANIAHYGTTTIPKMNLGNINSVPVGMFVGL